MRNSLGPTLRLPIAAVIIAILVAVPAVGFAQEVQWSRQFGGRGPDRARAIAVNGSGVYVAGTTEGSLPGERGEGTIDAFLRKYDSEGHELWTRQFGTTEMDDVLAVAADESGVYVAGGSQGDLHGQSNTPVGAHAFVRKYDLHGAEVWTREFGNGRSEEARAVAVGATGVHVAGNTTATSPPYDDGFVTAFATGGESRWSRWIETVGVDRVSAIAVNASGVYVAGATRGGPPGPSGAGGVDGFLRRYDLDGHEAWTRQVETAETGGMLSMTVDGTGLYLAGTTGGAIAGQARGGGRDAFASKYDFDGRLLWSRQFGTSADDRALGIAVHAQGVYIAGSTMGGLHGEVHAGDADGFVQRYDLNGVTAWTYQFGSGQYDQALGVAVDASGVYVAGATGGALPGHSNNGSFDAFVVKLR